MNLNDPFGRIANRRAREYQLLCESFREAGIRSRAEAEGIMAQARQRAFKSVVVALGVMLLGYLFAPELGVVILGLGGFFLVWVYNVTRNGALHIQRYIEEELRPEQASDD